LSFVSQSEEIAMGSEQYLLMQQAEGGLYLSDPTVVEYIKKVGHKLAAVSDRSSLPYEFVVLDNPIPNAWALPGGKIAINRGLLIELKSEAELAAVLSHEIVHSAARHGAKACERSILTQVGLVGVQRMLEEYNYQNIITGSALLSSNLLHLKYSREAELEADFYGIKYMVKAGYDPRAAIELQKIFLRLSDSKTPHWLLGLFATHPPSKERIKENEKTAALYPQDVPLIDGKEEYEKATLHLQKTKPAQELLQKGYHALATQNPKEALSCAEQGLHIAPSEAHLHNLAGKANLALHDFKGAFAYFQKAADLNPSYFDFYLGLGLS
jgi:predicted Zn-dependent protease